MAGSQLVHLEVRSIAGDLLEFDLPPQTVMADLKPKVMDLWQIPPVCQKWVVGSQAVDPHDDLASFVRGGLVSATLLVSMGAITDTLSSEAKSWADVEALQMVTKLGDRALPIVSSHLEDSLWGIRRACVQALGHLAPKGDEMALSAVRARLRDRDWSVRTAALEALVLLSSPQDELAIADAAAQVKDSFWCVRVTALRVLPQLAQRGHALAVEAARGCCDDKDSTVKRMAIEAVGQLAPLGDLVVLELVVGKLQDKLWYLRRAAVTALLQLASGPALAKHLRTLLEDQDGCVRLSALEGLGRLMEQEGHNDWVTLVALRGCLADQNHEVRAAAADLLRKKDWPTKP